MTSGAGGGKPNVDDISLEEPKPTKKSGSGVGWIVLVIIIVAAALFVYTSHVRKQRAEQEAQEKLAAAQARRAQSSAAQANVAEAVTMAEQGNMAAAIANLQSAENQYGLMVQTANDEGDTESATKSLADKQVVMDAREALEVEQQRFQEALKVQLDALRAKFGLPAAAAPTATESAPAGTEQPATGETQPAAGAEQPAPETPAPATEGAPPVEGAAPAAPVAPAPGG